MATTIKLIVDVEEIDNVLTLYDRIKVYRSTTGIDGAYAEISDASTRPALAAGQTTYTFDDLAGEITYWYKVSYFDSSLTNPESERSAARLGDDPATDNIMTVATLKDVYLIGIDLTDDAGNPYPDLHFKWGIRWAINWVEHLLDIKIRETPLVERYDYYFNDYVVWTIIQLRESPIVQVNGVSVHWPSNTKVIDFPTDWIQARLEDGTINIVPTSGTLSQVLLTAGGSFLPLLATGRDFVPNILEVDYVAGFADGQVPMAIRDLIGKLAAFGPLNIAGDLIVGAGIASKSVSMDGLSQSINTTSSATNAGYGARLGQYEKEIKQVVPVLQRYYKGMRLTSL